MLSLKIGDVVEIREDLEEVFDGYFSVIDEMMQYAGMKAEIKGFKLGDYWDVNNAGRPVGYTLDIDNGVYGWEESMFEVIP